MELGSLYQQFPHFSHFIDQVREFPHVAPHPFVCGLEGYYNVIGDRFFILYKRYNRPQLPFWEMMYSFGEWIQKWVYPVFEKPVMYYRAPYYGRVTKWVTDQYTEWHTSARAKFGVEEINMTISYLSAAADRLLSLKTENIMVQPERRHLKDIPPYITLSERATGYLSKSTVTDLSSIPSIVNAVKKRALRVPEVSFSRLKDINKTVRYDEIFTPKIQEG
jgi:hypothetical protein